MSHWVNRPMLVDTDSSQVLLNLSGSLWHADQVTWAKDGESVSLELRRYPGDVPGISLEINLETRTACFSTRSEMKDCSLPNVLSWLEAHYTEQKRLRT